MPGERPAGHSHITASQDPMNSWDMGWYLYDDGQVVGPLDAKQAFSRPRPKTPGKTIMVSRKGFSQWYPIENFAEIYAMAGRYSDDLGKAAAPSTSPGAGYEPVARNLAPESQANSVNRIRDVQKDIAGTSAQASEMSIIADAAKKAEAARLAEVAKKAEAAEKAAAARIAEANKKAEAAEKAAAEKSAEVIKKAEKAEAVKNAEAIKNAKKAEAEAKKAEAKAVAEARQAQKKAAYQARREEKKSALQAKLERAQAEKAAAAGKKSNVNNAKAKRELYQRAFDQQYLQVASRLRIGRIVSPAMGAFIYVPLSLGTYWWVWLRRASEEVNWHLNGASRVNFVLPMWASMIPGIHLVFAYLLARMVSQMESQNGYKTVHPLFATILAVFPPFYIALIQSALNRHWRLHVVHSAGG